MENQNFQTSDFYTAVFLLANKFKLIEIDKTNSRRFCFVFESIKELKTLMYNDAL